MRHFALLLTVVVSLVGSSPAPAQAPIYGQDKSKSTSGTGGRGGITHYTDGIIGQFDNSADFSLEPAKITTRVAAATGDRPAVLLVTAQIAEGKHAYSISQPSGGPRPTKIVLDPSSSYRLLAPLQAHPAPHSRVEKGPVWTGLTIEEHEGEVTWYAPLEITAGVDPKTFEVRGKIDIEVCLTGGSCEMVREPFVAKLENIPDLGFKLDTNLAPPASVTPASQAPTASTSTTPDSQFSTGEFQPRGSAVKFSGQIMPATVSPGQSAELVLTATLPPGGRIYAHADRDPQRGTKPVLISIQSSSGLIPNRPTTDAPMRVDTSVEQFGLLKYHERNVTWKLRLEVPANAKPGDYTINGVAGYQMCEYGGGANNVCELPQSLEFRGTVKVGNGPAEGNAPLGFAAGPGYTKVAAAAAIFADNFDRQAPGRESNAAMAPLESDVPTIGASDGYDLNMLVLESTDGGSLSYYIALAFVGGLILNLMPCVLPVISLKVMSFVEQAGHSRAHAFALNAWFAAGIISVFVFLGLLAATANLTWGGQFGSTAFNVTIAAVVFAMALSLLGVWEVPIPGFFGSGSVQAAAAQEGPLGAFLKGVVTTILATPCTAPFMASAVAWAVAQPTLTTLIVFASVGLGMASPYVLLSIFPGLLRFLPKPGAWMETFKQISGFVLLGTVVFILSFIEPVAIVPTLALLLGVGVACWFIARTPLTSEFGERLKSWAVAGVVVLVFVGFSFGILYRIACAPTDNEWQPFSLQRLKQVAVNEGRTVIVDFSADWCLNCKLLEKTVLHTKEVEQAIARYGVTKMYADFTDYPDEIDRTIKALKANGVPVIAVFPGGTPYEPYVFRDGYTANALVEALSKASGRRGSESVAEISSATPPRN